MYRRLLLVGALILLSACSESTFGKFQAQKGVPDFIHVGKTSRGEVIEKLGEPLVYRMTAGTETAIYNNERGKFYVLYGTYEGSELVVRFREGIVSEVKIEKTGSGWGVFAPATSNNPGTRRSAR